MFLNLFVKNILRTLILKILKFFNNLMAGLNLLINKWDVAIRTYPLSDVHLFK